MDRGAMGHYSPCGRKELDMTEQLTHTYSYTVHGLVNMTVLIHEHPEFRGMNVRKRMVNVPRGQLVPPLRELPFMGRRIQNFASGARLCIHGNSLQMTIARDAFL